jgi:hypothetical protein
MHAQFGMTCILQNPRTPKSTLTTCWSQVMRDAETARLVANEVELLLLLHHPYVARKQAFDTCASLC